MTETAQGSRITDGTQTARTEDDKEPHQRYDSEIAKQNPKKANQNQINVKSA
jgi:hypothetical protein